MSRKAREHVFPLTHAPTGEPIPPAEKLVLVNIADFCNEQKGYAWPPQERLAAQSCMSEGTLRRKLRWLEANELLRTEPYHDHRGYRAGLHYYLPTLEAENLAATDDRKADAAYRPSGPAYRPSGPAYRPPVIGQEPDQPKEPLSLSAQKEKPSARSVASRRDGGNTWPEWAAEYSGHTGDGIIPAVGGAYLARCAKGDIAPPCSLGDLRALIVLIRLLKSGLGVRLVTLPSPNDTALAMRAADARAWRGFCQEHPEFATFEALYGFYEWPEPRRGWDGERVLRSVGDAGKLEAKVEERAEEKQRRLRREQRRREREADPDYKPRRRHREEPARMPGRRREREP